MISQLLHQVGQSGPASRARLQSGTRTMAWPDVLKKVADLAQCMRNMGVRRVALCADNGIDWILADLASQLAGVCTTPLPLFFSETQMRHAIATSGADALIADQNRLPLFIDAGLISAPGQTFAGATNIYILKSDRSVVLPDGTQKITYTSGTTGTPKGVCLSATQQWLVANAIASIVDLDRPKHLCVLPLSTLLENLAGVYAPLLAGGTVVAPSLAEVGLTGSSQLDVRRLLACIAQHEPSSLILVPELLQALTQAAENGWAPPATLKFLAVGGGKVAPDLLRRARFAGLPAFEGYGLSECASVVTLNVPGADCIGAVGRPLPHADVRIEHGEIVVRGSSFLGYANQPETWSPGPVFTGDLGRTDKDGFVYVAGRAKNQLITSYGRNISPEWVESELTAGPLLRQAVVVGDARPFCIALLATTNAATSDAEIASWIHEANTKLPDYARVLDWYRLPEPLSSHNGMTTENGRPKREIIEAEYGAAINSLYEKNLEAYC